MQNNISAIRDLMHFCVNTGPKAVFFKTGPGQYAEHDTFIGVSVPDIRKIAKEFKNISIDELQILIQSKVNEERLLAIIILVQRYKVSDEQGKEIIYEFYLKNLNHVNNWNLVDASAYSIIGAHLWSKDKSILIDLAKSDVLWLRRISIVSTLYFIKKNDLVWTFKIVDILMNDTEDLIHKSAGWMLREAGKQDKSELIKFLDHNASIMPRTMLRYAIEWLSKEQKKVHMLQRYL